MTKTSFKRLLSLSGVSVLALMGAASISTYAAAAPLTPEACGAQQGGGAADGCAPLLEALAPAAGSPSATPGDTPHAEFDADSHKSEGSGIGHRDGNGGPGNGGKPAGGKDGSSGNGGTGDNGGDHNGGGDNGG
ncbi:MAG TPA: hypothetical protein VFE11_15320, partial [Dongiaceae bacterium]|nr:hypothetical protein [Dongiaceae bacterium]